MSAAAALRAGRQAGAEAALSPGGHEWTAGSVIRALTSESLLALERLATWSSRGELRDLEDEGAWDSLPFYAAAASALRSAWHAHDRAVLGAVEDSAHETFVYDQAHGGHPSPGAHIRRIVDDEEEEINEADEANSGAAVQEAWRRLQACYTFVARLLSVPELQADVARRRGAFDGAFVTALVARFEPKFRKQGPLSAASAAQLHQQNLQAVTGVGGVAMGSSNHGATGNGAASLGPSRGVSAVAPASLVGMGVKSAEPDSPLPQELSLLRGLLHTMYSTFVPLRPTLRNLIGNYLQRYLRAPNHPQGVSEILQVYAAVVRGAGVPLAAQHRDFLCAICSRCTSRTRCLTSWRR